MRHLEIYIFISLFLLSCGSDENLPYYFKPNSDDIIDDNYNWKSEEEINTQGEFKIKTNNLYEQIIFDTTHGKLLSALSYKNNLESFNFNGLYKIKDSNNNTFYFRFGWVSYDNMTMFNNVNWVDGKIPNYDEFESVKISTVSIDYVQKGYIKVCTIGDSQSWWRHASRLRKQMNIEKPVLKFVGSNIDIYGYPHEAEGGNNTSEVLNRFEFIPEADYYTILIGTNDWQKGIDTTFTNLIELITKLKKKYPDSKIVYATPLPTTNEKRDQFNLNLKNKIETYSKTNANVLIANLGENIRKDINWSKYYLDKDGLHPNETGVCFMAKILSNYIYTDFENNNN